ncbi:hypothetical protein MYAM1_003565 [Malassezia yamatoensis]|uniref:Ornithine decarboxylase antizyme n=1 Tax=Malassezia yamatoensis TaxID=253288 RepID=A0AAJ6CHY6_9BASI|nr:hypothetical protein MYAM1_003565 [Malassezia yamatoensis]
MPGISVPGRSASVRETTPSTTSAENIVSAQPIHLSTTVPISTLPLSPPPSPPLRPRRSPSDTARIAADHDTSLDPVREAEPHPATNRWLSDSMNPLDHTVQLLRHAAQFDVPSTPDMSPANQELHHYPTQAAEAFMRRIFLDWNHSGQFQAEDAGVELVCAGWTGAVAQKLDLPTSSQGKLPLNPGTRSLYVHMPRSCDRSLLRDHILQLLDLASERVRAERVVFCLERNLPDLHSLLRGLYYVGGHITPSRSNSLDSWTEFHAIPSLIFCSVHV